MSDTAAFRIRPATAADSEPIKRAVHQARLDRTGLDWRHFKVAELDDSAEMIGFCQVRRYAGVRELGSLYVRKAYRGHAIGGALIRACLAEQPPPVHLECVAARQPYYERFGFQRIPKRHAPLALALKSAVGASLTWLALRQHIIVMRWDGPQASITSHARR
ncbi:MAG: GNAT family N-acetyltransferase [Burkholderiales bacterium]|jgi:N-acetylglutamate synthase-like GNAT family acetyltransferase|nr:GNAT family N-acetyltransferase [Burkholderiales bacterium]